MLSPWLCMMENCETDSRRDLRGLLKGSEGTESLTFNVPFISVGGLLETHIVLEVWSLDPRFELDH